MSVSRMDLSQLVIFKQHFFARLPGQSALLMNYLFSGG